MGNKNLWLLPTDKPSRLYKSEVTGELEILSNYNINVDGNGKNIYITSNEEIKPSDYYLWKGTEVIKANDIEICFHSTVLPYCKKIILTTDQDLIKDGIQAIDDEFLEWFVKNPSCEEVFITNDFEQVNQDNPILRGSTNVVHKYKIIIPKEEPIQEGYICPHTKIQCDDECCVSAEDCHIKSSIGILSEPKQETLEKAFKFPLTIDNAIDFLILSAKMFNNGAKWQQEQIGKSEFLQKLRATLSDAEARRLIFETFKNK